MPQLPALDPITLTLDLEDQAAMPSALRSALLAWHQQHRALQQGQAWEDALVVPKQVSQPQLLGAVLRAVHAGLDAVFLRPWVERFSCPDNTYHDRRVHALELVIEARRSDLLEALLESPGLRPAHTTGKRNGFNGGLWSGARRADPQAYGLVFLVQLWEHRAQFRRGHDPLTGDFPDLMAQRDAAGQEVGRAQNIQQQRVGDLVVPTARGMGPLDVTGARHTRHLNLVGLAVLHGWSEGVRQLLDEGIDPYAHQGGLADRHSALVVACAFHEAEAAVALLSHTSFQPSMRYGRQGPVSVGQRSREHLWRQIDPALDGGYEWNLVCRSALIEDPRVNAVMQARWARFPAGIRRRFLNDDPVAALRWEQAELRAVAEDVAPHLDATAQRPRARL